MLPIWLVLILLGVVLGLSQVFPISGSAHLALVSKLVNFGQINLSLVTGLHVGSLVAILYQFRQDISEQWGSYLAGCRALYLWLVNHRWRVWSAWRREERFTNFGRHQKEKAPFFFAASLIPLAVVGLLLKQAAEGVFESVYWSAGFLMVMGILVCLVVLRPHGDRTLTDLLWWEFIVVALGQGLAVLPGISRLGMALCVGLWLGLNWHEALKLSFLYAIPTLIGAILVHATDLIATLSVSSEITVGFGLAMGVTGVVSYIGLRWLIGNVLERRTLVFFGQYCLMLGIVTLAYFWE